MVFYGHWNEVDRTLVGCVHKNAMYVIANQFGHRVINFAGMDELMTARMSLTVCAIKRSGGITNYITRTTKRRCPTLEF